jgi:hypothetical protein
MTDYDDEDMHQASEPHSFMEDVLSQRAYALAEVGQLAMTARSGSDQEVRSLCLEMMRKINASLALPGDPPPRHAELRIIN